MGPSDRPSGQAGGKAERGDVDRHDPLTRTRSDPEILIDHRVRYCPEAGFVTATTQEQTDTSRSVIP